MFEKSFLQSARPNLHFSNTLWQSFKIVTWNLFCYDSTITLKNHQTSQSISSSWFPSFPVYLIRIRRRAPSCQSSPFRGNKKAPVSRSFLVRNTEHLTVELTTQILKKAYKFHELSFTTYNLIRKGENACVPISLPLRQWLVKGLLTLQVHYNTSLITFLYFYL